MTSPTYTFDWSVLFSVEVGRATLGGIVFTIGISLASLLLGSVLGLVCALVRVSNVPVLAPVARIYTEFFRTTPGLVQLIWIFYALPVVLRIELPLLVAGVLALTLSSGAILTETFRSGIESVGRGQRDASRVLDFTPGQTLTHVVLPQAARRVLPVIASTFILLVKESSLLSVVAVPEITYQAQTVVNDTFRPLEVYSALALMYFAMTYPISILGARLEKRFTNA